MISVTDATHAATFYSRLARYALIYCLWVLSLVFLTGGFWNVDTWLSSWHRWDAQLYEQIWRERYQGSSPKLLAFPPGYPLLVGFLSSLTSLSFYSTGLVLNVAAFFVFAVIASELLMRTMPVPALPLFCLILTSPTAYFIFPAYTDCLYAACLWGALYLALLKPSGIKYRAAEFLLLVIGPWLRLTGYALSVWAIFRRYSSIAVFISLAGWLSLNNAITGHAFHFVKAQTLFLLTEGNLFDGIVYSFRLVPVTLPGNSGGDWQAYLQFHLLPVVYFVALLGTGAWFCWNRQMLVGSTIIAILLFSHNLPFWRSSLRYDLPLMPFLFALLLSGRGTDSKKRGAFGAGVVCGAIGTCQLILQVYFAILFTNGAWAF